jgi:hypothetical protein
VLQQRFPYRLLLAGHVCVKLWFIWRKPIDIPNIVIGIGRITGLTGVLSGFPYQRKSVSRHELR